MTAELGTWAGAIGAAVHGAEVGGRAAAPERAARTRGMTEVGYQPQYRRIEQAMRQRIATLQPGERLPSDAELQAEFGVSRMTARNAMQRLTEEGLIAREPGRGSFVADGGPPACQPAHDLHPRDAPSRADAMIADPDPRHPAVDAARGGRARPATGEPIVHLRRLRLRRR